MNQKEIDAAYRELQDLKAKEQDIRDQQTALCNMIKTNHPDSVVIGDVVQCNGYSFNGQDMTVDTVIVKATDPPIFEKKDLPKYIFTLKAYGRVHNRDGKPGQRKGEYKIILK